MMEHVHILEPVHWLENVGGDPRVLMTACGKFTWVNVKQTQLLDPNRNEVTPVTCPGCLAARTRPSAITINISERTVRFTYKNWRGEVAERTVTPTKLYFGESEYTKDAQTAPPQWYLVGWCHDRCAPRWFALADIQGAITCQTVSR